MYTKATNPPTNEKEIIAIINITKKENIAMLEKPAAKSTHNVAGNIISVINAEATRA